MELRRCSSARVRVSRVALALERSCSIERRDWQNWQPMAGVPFRIVLRPRLLWWLATASFTIFTTPISSGGQRSSLLAVVLHRDLRRPANPQEALALRERYLPNAPEVLRHDYLASLHAAFTVEEVRAQLDRCGLHSLRVEALADRYLEVSGRLC